MSHFTMGQKQPCVCFTCPNICMYRRVYRGLSHRRSQEIATSRQPNDEWWKSNRCNSLKSVSYVNVWRLWGSNPSLDLGEVTLFWDILEWTFTSRWPDWQQPSVAACKDAHMSTHTHRDTHTGSVTLLRRLNICLWFETDFVLLHVLYSSLINLNILINGEYSA